MNDTDTDIVIETIPIERIVVLNPRIRDAGKFAEIVDSIDKVGLKQPIKVSQTRGADGEVAYSLVYGQGRMEAFLALGQTEIPAIVTDLSEEDILLSSLVENIARTKPRPGDLFRAIGDLAGRGYSNSKIAAKIGYSADYVGKLRRLMEAGEERLLVAVEAEEIPLKVAIAISETGSGQAQDVLVDAYKSGELTVSQMPRAKSVIARRERYGKAQRAAKEDRNRAHGPSEELARNLKKIVKTHIRLIEKADFASEHLKVLVRGLRVLLSDYNFLTLLRAEQVRTMPAPLARLVEAPEET